MNADQFHKQADSLVSEFFDYLRGDEETHLGTHIIRDSAYYDSDELAKHHRKIWLRWAREKKANGDEIPEGWLSDYHSQTRAHQEVQKMQADAMFALGYQAAIEDMKNRTDESFVKVKSVASTKRSAFQFFTTMEGRILLASFMAFVSFQLKRKNIGFDKTVVDRLLQKLAVLSDVNVDHVDYFQPQNCQQTSAVKPKWKRDSKRGGNKGGGNRNGSRPNNRPAKGRNGLGHMVRKR